MIILDTGEQDIDIDDINSDEIDSLEDIDSDDEMDIDIEEV
jgi:hypothetical protein